MATSRDDQLHEGPDEPLRGYEREAAERLEPDTSVHGVEPPGNHPDDDDDDGGAR